MKNQDAATEAKENRLESITKQMIEIETINAAYNKATNNGQNPNGEEAKIENLLNVWDKLKMRRDNLKRNKFNN